MKHDAIKKHGNKWVRIRPALQVYNDSGVLTQDAVEDAWLLSEITEKSAKLRSRDTQHVKVIGLDHIHHYMEDPEGHPGMDTSGVLVMNVQLLIHEGELIAEPVAQPGAPLKAFVRAKPRANLLRAATQRRAQIELDDARKKYAWSVAGVQEAKNAFADFPKELTLLHDALSNAGQAIDIQIRGLTGQALMLIAAGWWVTFQWRPKAANCIEDSFLTVTQWDGVPPWPGLLVIQPGEPFTESRFTWGLAALNQPRWLAEHDPNVSYTSADLAEMILTNLLERPRDLDGGFGY